MLKIIPTIAFLYCSCYAFSQTEEVNSIASFPHSVHDQAEILDMGQDFIELQEIQKDPDSFDFRPLENANTNLGFTDHHYWVKFTLNNESSIEKTLFLETARPITDLADLYFLSSDQPVAITRNGDTYPFQQRKVSHRNLLFPITLSANSTNTFYLHLKSDGEVINLPLTIHDSTSLIESTFQDQLVFGIFYGILLLAGITYLFFYFGIKEKSFLLYVAYVVSIGLLHSSLDGYFFQYILQSPGWFADRSLLIFATLSAILLNRYNQVFVGVRRFSKGLDYAFNSINISLLILLLSIFIIDLGRPLYYPLVNGLGFLGVLLIITSIALSYIKRKPVDIFFALGITSLTIGFITFILNNFSLIENSFITENASKLGTGLEVIFLSLSMANRIRILRNEKEKAQGLALQRSEESNEIKSFFLANMSHELRTPLNAILGLSQSIMKEISDERIKENLEVIKYSSVSLLSSIDDILDYSKIEKGELNLEQKPFDLQKSLSEIKALTYQQARDKGLIFSYEENVELPKRIVGDAVRFRQILNNILHNAIKFTPSGKVKLQVSQFEEIGENQQVTFKISDTGIGIKPEKLDRIFESFIQEQLDDKRKFGGFGLGLCIVKALTDLYQGSVAIESKPGVGTTVDVKLTFQKAQEEPFESIKKNAKTILKGKSILVVEDNPVNQLVIKSILRKWEGITFDFAGHGIEALDRLNSKSFDLILMDLQMPEMDGYEATEAIRKGQGGDRHTNIPIIAVTADTTEKSKIRASTVGMDDYLTKPVDAELLLEKVVKAIYLDKIEIDFTKS
ncbi:hybrid sensor histidine kinase/response regulator [Algoriphagus boritolerans]|uniref:histidine kinase n=1 Tax=Algoriphagus boritolerans DSM 17298 = JCM 18970 TaxID=1120964 RepID=A0A1H5TNU4_9BACT|nr:hybrid sensor histidine kinase/response regulator [Algoriphagus boritolerans]SEF64453.1 Signal transduction histidine kinase [Algoriphagus boritolerans DSM 17298 = JCM 18970]